MNIKNPVIVNSKSLFLDQCNVTAIIGIAASTDPKAYKVIHCPARDSFIPKLRLIMGMYRKQYS
ncbi:hypothetical protein HZP16_07240 [Elizabethkingia anophelis]|nr:hypothetical protein [Elizabethkingia anophelis]